MTMEELIPKLMEHADEYAVESYEDIVVGVEPVKKHKRWRTQKKWIKRWGMQPKIEHKKCRKIDVTPAMCIDFCNKYGYPIPDEIQMMFTNNTPRTLDEILDSVEKKKGGVNE